MHAQSSSVVRTLTNRAKFKGYERGAGGGINLRVDKNRLRLMTTQNAKMCYATSYLPFMRVANKNVG